MRNSNMKFKEYGNFPEVMRMVSTEFREGWEYYNMKSKEDMIERHGKRFFIDENGHPWYTVLTSDKIPLLHKMETISVMSSNPFISVHIDSSVNTFYFGHFGYQREGILGMLKVWKETPELNPVGSEQYFHKQ